MKSVLGKDARGFVDGVMRYLRTDGKSSASVGRVEGFLGKVSSRAKREKLAKVTTSVVLTKKEEASLMQAISRIIGHDVELECRVDPSVIGGLIIQVGDWIVDTSLKSQLEEMATIMEQ